MDNHQEPNGSRFSRLVNRTTDSANREQQEVEQWFRARPWVPALLLVILAVWVVVFALVEGGS